MATKSEKFILERKEYWKKLYDIVKKIKTKGYNSLTEEEFQEFPNLYRKTCTDSETAKTLKLSPDTVEYINSIVLQSHNILYSAPKKTFTRIKIFFKYDFPDSFLKNIIPIAVIFVLFFGINILTASLINYNPQLIHNILSENQIEEYKKMYQDIAQGDIATSIYASGHYIENNVTIGFTSFVLGITYGLLTLYIVIFNGLYIGAVTGLLISSGYGFNFFNFVIAHSAFELIGLVLSGGAGLSLGLSMIIAKDEKRSIIISKKARELVPIIITAGIFIFFAAFIEGFISSNSKPVIINLGIIKLIIPFLIIKISVTVISLILIIMYSYRIFIIRIVKRIKK